MALSCRVLELQQSMTTQIQPSPIFKPNAVSSPMANLSHSSLNPSEAYSSESYSTFSGNDEDTILMQNGYKKTDKICSTLQGELYQGLSLSNNSKVAIKRTYKSAHVQHIASLHGAIYSVEEDIVKEAHILHYLTVRNRPTAQYIIQYIDFIETEHCYYLIMEYPQQSINLQQFILTAQQYIACNKLQRKEYNKIIKYIFWQICVVLRWLHVDMNCCHLDLKADNIILENVEFRSGSNGNIHINPSVSIKLCDFGRSEVFKQTAGETNDIFDCAKECDMQYIAHKLNGASSGYDARSADIWSLGMMMYHCYVGCSLFSQDTGYFAWKTGKLKQHLLQTPSIKAKMVDVLCKMMEQSSCSMMDILKHSCFKMYYQKYKKRIVEKARTQKLQLLKQKNNLRTFPYYNIDKKVSFV